MDDSLHYIQFSEDNRNKYLFRISEVPGLYLATKNLNPGKQVYGERLFETKYGELREFVPSRSKLASSLVSGLNIKELHPSSRVLYLGASFGTTPSHMSDLLSDGGRIYAVEFAPRPMRDLLNLAQDRTNIIPILGDARNPAEYSEIVEEVEFLYCDVAQANQSELFIKNAEFFLESGGTGMIAIKAKSISQIKHPKEVFQEQREILKEAGFSIFKEIDIGKFHRDHRVFLGKWR